VAGNTLAMVVVVGGYLVGKLDIASAQPRTAGEYEEGAREPRGT